MKTLTPTEQTIHEFLKNRGELWPHTALEISEQTGYPLSTVYAALRGLHAVRTKRGKNQFGYLLPDEQPVEFPSVDETPGFLDGKPWREVAQSTMRVVTEAALIPDISAQDYAEGFEALGRRFLELAAHAAAVQDRPDWRIVLGFETDTEKV